MTWESDTAVFGDTYKTPLAKDCYWQPSDARRDSDTIATCITALGGDPAPWRDIDLFDDTSLPTMGEFAKYLADSGIRRFEAPNVCAPSDRRKAKSVGFRWMLPPRYLWGYAIATLTFAEMVREAIGYPMVCKGLWRPLSYNRLVSTTGIKSDHTSACGIDIVFSSKAIRSKGEGVARGLCAVMPELEVSLGLGNTRMHFGALSPKGTRVWKYGSYGEKVVLLRSFSDGLLSECSEVGTGG